MIENTEIPIPCQKCGAKTKKTIGWLKTNPEITCRCGAITEIDATRLNQQIASVEKELKAFSKLFGKR